MQWFAESVNWYWKEMWKLKDDKDTKDARDSSIVIPRVSRMINWKSSIDKMYDRISSRLFEPRGSLVASWFLPKFAVRANYSYEYPGDKSPHLSASTSWKKEENELKCSFQHEDGDWLYTSEGLLNFEKAEQSLCSVALRKKIDESKSIQVAFDTNNTTTIDFSYCVDTKFTFKVCAKVDAGNIKHSGIKASFTYQ